jgi:hypothetical protein
MSAYWGSPVGANYYTVRDKSREDLKDIIALELEEDAREDARAFNVCKDCGHTLYHANTTLANKCGKLG